MSKSHKTPHKLLARKASGCPVDAKSREKMMKNAQSFNKFMGGHASRMPTFQILAKSLDLAPRNLPHLSHLRFMALLHFISHSLQCNKNKQQQQQQQQT